MAWARSSAALEAGVPAVELKVERSHKEHADAVAADEGDKHVLRMQRAPWRHLQRPEQTPLPSRPHARREHTEAEQVHGQEGEREGAVVEERGR
eukprot:scaffold60730_cov75-Phaeocystis_antarctica.AAC.9